VASIAAVAITSAGVAHPSTREASARTKARPNDGPSIGRRTSGTLATAEMEAR
jgi:hypothetical protein